MEHQKENNAAFDNYMRFLRLCKLLLKNDMMANKIAKDNEFYELARKTTEEYHVNWDNMNFSDSDSIMLDMLFTAWQDIRVGQNVDIKVTFNVYGDKRNSKGKRPS